MNWLRQNPKLAAVVIATLCASATGTYFIYTFQSAFGSATEEYNEKISTIARLRAVKPFPDKANLEKVESELKDAEAMMTSLSRVLAKQSNAIDPNLDPQKFQDKLNKAVSSVTDAAHASGTKLPEGFYLGFDKYRTELPSVTSAPLLGQQLAAITSAIKELLDSHVESIDSLSRHPLPCESAPPKESSGNDGQRKEGETGMRLGLAPFDIVFTGDQSRCHEAFMGIMTAEPILFVRLVGVLNSSPDPPPKTGDNTETPAAASGQQPSQEARIPVAFGQEKITVALRLASLSGGNIAEPAKK